MTIAQIDIVNESTAVSDADVSALTEALQIQITRDFAPVWGHDAKLTFVPKGGAIDPSFWVLAVLDNSDQAGALGYHDVTPTGQPLGKAFAGSCKQYGTSWTVDVSHELTEMLADPGISTTVTLTDAHGNQVLTALEVADACEDDSCGYEINSILVSDFVYPTWFGVRPNNPGVDPAKLDQTDKLPMSLVTAVAQGTSAAALAKGGYISLQSAGAAWTQVTAREVIEGSAYHHPTTSYQTLSNTQGGRVERRLRGASTFMKSRNA